MNEPEVTRWNFDHWEKGSFSLAVIRALWLMLREGRFILVTARFTNVEDEVDIQIRYARLTPKGMKFILRKALEFDDDAEELVKTATDIIRRPTP